MNVKLKGFEMRDYDAQAKISAETFDEFLDGLNLLNICEEEAINGLRQTRGGSRVLRGVVCENHTSMDMLR
jgi:hypothetical protein